MSEFFLELFSEEIPASLQKNLRENLLENFNKLFNEKFITFKKSSSYSTPNRLIILFEGLQKQIILKSEEIKGPNVNAPQVALEGFIKSNSILNKDLFKKKIDKGEFYFFKTKSKKINTHDLLEELVPLTLQKIQWKKSMKWGSHELTWARPLKSILAVFDKKKIIFKLDHLSSSNITFIDKEFEDKTKIFLDFKTYNNFFKSQKIIIDHNQRKKFIEEGLQKISITKKIVFENNQKFVQESLTGFNDSFFYGLPIFLELKDYVHVQSSGLQLTKSPGQFWVYLGSILLVLGIFCMIYIQEVRLWILKKKNNKNVLLALATNRHRYEFDQFAKKVSQQIRKILN